MQPSARPNALNFLAHSMLGFDNPALIAGQFCGDFVRGRDLSRFPPQVEHGIRLHRHLDRFTDTHAALNPIKQSMQNVPRRLAGIVVDVMFDHFLAHRWNTVSALSLDEHASQVHSALSDYQTHFPPALLRFMAVLERERLLQNNIHLESIEQTLVRIASRSPAFQPLALTVDQLQPLNESLIQPFESFLPDLQQTAISYIDQGQVKE